MRFSLVLLPLALLLAACGSPSAAPTATPPPTATAAPSTAGRTLAPPLPGSYAALGASETYGMGAQPRSDAYPYQIAHALHATRFVDEGIPGTTLEQGYDTELTNALAIRPSLVTVFFGFNDISQGVSRASFLADLRDLSVTLHRAHAHVLIIGLPDLSLLPAVQRTHLGGVHAIVTSWNSGMASVARQTGASFLDLSAFSARLAAHPNYISPDGLHPSDAGHTALAQTILPAIQRNGLWTGR